MLQVPNPGGGEIFYSHLGRGPEAHPT